MYFRRMAQKKTDLVQQLVKSLTPAEKRHFTRSLPKAAKQPNYLKLYHELEKAEDTSKLRKTFSSKSFNISYETEYLLQNLLSALRSYHEETTPSSDLVRSLADIEMLYAKQQYHLALHLIDTNIEIAERRGKFYLLLELLTAKRKTAGVLTDSKGYAELMDQLYKQQTDGLRKAENLLEFRQIQGQMFFIFGKRGNMSSEAIRSEFEALMKNPLLQNIDQALSSEAQTLYFEVWHRYYITLQDYQSALEISNQFVAVLEAQPDLIRERPYAYVVALTNTLNAAITNNKYDLALQTIDKISAIKNIRGARNNESVLSEIKSVELLFPITIQNNLGNFKKALEIYEQHLREKTADKIIIRDYFWSFYYVEVLRAQFYNRRFDEALKTVQLLFDRENKRQRIDILLAVHLFQIMVQYELGHTSVVPYLIKSAKRFVKASGFNEKIIDTFFKVVSELNAAAEDDRVGIRKKYRPLFDKSKLSMGEQAVVGTLQLQHWLA